MIRTIVTPDKASISFDIPERFVGREIEVLAFERDNSILSQGLGKKKVTFDAVSLDTSGFRFNREEANE